MRPAQLPTIPEPYETTQPFTRLATKQIIPNGRLRPGQRTFKPEDSQEKGAPINFHPFWVCPRGLLYHNMYIASQMNLRDTSSLQSNLLGNLGITLILSQFGKEYKNGALIWVGLNMSAWLLWVSVPSLRKYLTSPELLDGLLL